MKKHPVDDLFSRKLRDAEITPRDEVYQKLQQRLHSKQKRLGWWQQGPWLAAAGVSLLLGAGWIVWKSAPSEEIAIAQHHPQKPVEAPPKPSGSIASVKKAVKVSPETSNKQVLPLSVPQEVASVETKKIPHKSQQQEKSDKLTQKPLLQQTPTVQVAQTTEAPQKVPVTGIIHDEPKVIAQVQAPSAESKPSTKTVVMQLPELQESLVAANEKPISGPLTEPTVSKTDENILNEPRKSTRMAKVWRQLKNAKNGERVDWEEVGFNPNKLLAKATRKEL
jgi:hypothetical protein